MSESSKTNNIYFKNFILCGEIDFYCILCQKFFASLNSVDEHLILDNHINLLRQQSYCKNFKNDFIYKIKSNFYCEVCNELTNNPVRHQANSSHTDALSHPKEPTCFALKYLVLRHPDGIITIENNIKLKELEWYGIIDDFCAICLKKVCRDAWKHITLEEHATHLIRTFITKIQGVYYRMVNHDKFFCFVCLDTFEMKTMEYHVARGCRISSNYSSEKPSRSLKTLIKSHTKLNQFIVVVDEETKTVQCLSCNEQFIGRLDFIFRHKDSHPSDRYNVVDHGKRKHELAIFGKTNYICLNSHGRLGYCSLCHVFIVGSMQPALEHVRGRRHQNFLKLKNDPNPLSHDQRNVPPILFRHYLKNIYKSGGFDDCYIVNVQLHVPYTNFMILAPYRFNSTKNSELNKYICFLCNAIIQMNQIKQHCETQIHINNMLACYVIVGFSDPLTFIRMISAAVYHCGICNSVYPYLETISRHIKSGKHIARKTRAVMPETEAKIKMLNEIGSPPKCHQKNRTQLQLW